jgi:hypothetical protein
VSLRMVKPLTAVALAWGPLFVGPLDRDRQVTHGFEIKDRALVLGDLDEDQGQRFFRPGGGHSGHLDRRQALFLQVRSHIINGGLARDRTQDGSEFFARGERTSSTALSSPRVGESVLGSRRR